MSPLVDWYAEDFGGHVHESSVGSWTTCEPEEQS